MYNKSQLPNGLRLATYKMAHRESAAVGIWVGAGGRYEDKVDNGIAHVLEHLSFKGTKKYSATKIKETIEGLGGSLNAFTSEEYTCYLTKIVAKHLPLVIDILSDMVLNPSLLKKDLDKEKSVICEEIKMYRDLPQSYVYELLDELIWPGHPLGMNLAGTIESVSSITPQLLAGFHHRLYQTANMVVSVCGNVGHRKIHKQIAGIFGKENPKKNIEFVKVNISQDKPRVNLFFKETEQSHLAIGYLGLERQHPDRHALALLHIILGANMSSRLFNEVREKKGLAYEIGTQVKRLSDTGVFLVHAGVDNRKVVMAIATIFKEMEKISQKQVSRDEFTRAKEYYTGQLLLGLEDTLDHMLWLGEQEISLRKIKTIRDILKEIETVDISDLRRVAKHIFRDNRLSLALIGPQSDSEKKEIMSVL